MTKRPTKKPKTGSPKKVAAPLRQLPALAPGLARNVALLVERVVTILEEARSQVVRTVNSTMVLAYWHVGREIVEFVPGGSPRAEYGEQVLEELSTHLRARMGRGFSVTNLRYFRIFYLRYSDRWPEIYHEARDESAGRGARPRKRHEARDEWAAPVPQGFSSRLSWTHYRTLTKLDDRDRALVLLVQHGCDLDTWKPLMLWHMTRDEFLVRDFLLHWLFPAYDAGAFRIHAGDLISFLHGIRVHGAKTEHAWSEQTLKRVAAGLLKQKKTARQRGMASGRRRPDSGRPQEGARRLRSEGSSAGPRCDRRVGRACAAHQTAWTAALEDRRHRVEIPADKSPPIWRAALDDMMDAYEQRCPYLAMFIERTGNPTIDHVIPESRTWNLVYEWSNYRLCAGIVNSKKGALIGLVDPVRAKVGWFELDLATFRVLRGTSAPKTQHQKIAATLPLLNIRDCCLQRQRYVEDYRLGPGARGIDLPYLEHRAPFIAFELRRQRQLVRGDA